MTKPDPARIIVPRKQGEILIEPPLAMLRSSLSRSIGTWKILGIPAGDAGIRARGEFVDAARKHAENIDAEFPTQISLDKPWVVTGHQVEFFHAGVWAKMIAVDALAKKTGAVPFDLLVDHDTVGNFGFDMPEQDAGGKWKRKSVIWGVGGQVAVEGAARPNPEAFDAWDAELARFPLGQSDALAIVLTKLRTAEGNYTQWMSNARTQLEAALDIKAHHVPTSAMCDSVSWHLLVLAWIRNAEEWTHCYNAELAAYRKAQGIHNNHHPMPDLAREGGAIELPFWIYKVGTPRERLMVTADGIRWGRQVIPLPSVGDGWAAAEELKSLLTAAGVVVRPRALTLTMFVRLFLSDLFIHGIGGALYDQITDGILQKLFGDVPSYACVSAAWLLPLGNSQNAEEISTLHHRRHRLLHNPQTAIDPFTALKTDYAELIAQRRMLIENLRTGEKSQRREWFDQLHATNAALHEKSPRLLKRADEEIAAAKVTAEQNKVTQWREYYFALHTMESLRRFTAKVRGEK